MTHRFRQVFTHRHVILPVVHLESPEQALRNTRLVRDLGCDGAFLINHQGSHGQLMAAHSIVSQELPGFWLGINSLGRDPETCMRDAWTAGLWVDNAGIDEDREDQPFAQSVRQLQGDWPGLYFGGVAFKGQRRVENLERAAQLAARYMDVVTTSGPGTGCPASVAKIQRMKQAVPDVPLAIASGITPDNVEDYLPFADCFLVATGIGRSFTEFDPVLVERLVTTVRNWSAKHARAGDPCAAV